MSRMPAHLHAEWQRAENIIRLQRFVGLVLVFGGGLLVAGALLVGVYVELETRFGVPL